MKHTIRHISWIVIVLITLVSCTKFGKNITIKGRVLNPITGEGISGVEIWLLKSTLGLPGGNKTIKTVFSDGNGNFELNKLSVSAESVRIGNMHGDYYAIGWYRDGEHVTEGTTLPIKKGKKMYVDFHAVPYGKYKANVINVNCQGATDTAYFKWKYTLDPDAYDYWSPPRLGCYSNNDENIHQLPIGEYIWVTKVIRSGNTIYQYDTLFVDESGVSIFNINY